MLIVQGTLWLVSLILHIVFLPVLMKMTAARWAIRNGVSLNDSECACEPCDFSNIEDEVSRAQAKRICDAAC